MEQMLKSEDQVVELEDENRPPTEQAEQDQLPHPETAKIKELTEYYRVTGDLPEGWSKMKAVEKRKTFRRQFCPQATETFDPNDPTHLITERVENMVQGQVRPTVHRLTEDVGMNYFELGGVFARISREGWYQDFGHQNFKEWVEAETDMKRVKAEYLLRIYVKFVELDIPWAKFKGVGWTKTIELLPVINQENVDEWVEKARVRSVRLLREEVKAAKTMVLRKGMETGTRHPRPSRSTSACTPSRSRSWRPPWPR